MHLIIIAHKMGRYTFILIMMMAIVGVACHHTKDERLEQLYMMLDTQPQEALSQLEALEKDYARADEHIRMWYALVRYKAEDKCYRPLTSDSTIKKICTYFEEQGDHREKMESFFYLGRTYHELRNYPSAVEAYGHAALIAETSHLTWSDSIVLSRIYGHMADVNRRINRNQEAYKLMRKSFQMQVVLGDDDIRTYEDMGRFADMADSLEEAKELYHATLVMIAKEKATEEYVTELGEQLNFYCYTKDQEFAELTYNLIKKIHPDSLPANVFSSIAIYFDTFEKDKDSTLYYNLMALERITLVERKASTTKKIARLYEEKGEKEQALRYAMESLAYADSANCVIQEEDTKASKEQIHLQTLEGLRMMETEKEMEKKLNITIIIALVTFMIALVFLTLYLLNRRKLKISLLTKERDEIKEQNQKLEQVVETDRRLRTENATDITSLRTRLKRIGESTKEKLEEGQWEEVFDAVDKFYPQYRECILNIDSQLESPDLIFLYLVKLGYKQADIARILKKPRSTVNRQFHELEKRMGGKMEGMAS